MRTIFDIAPKRDIEVGFNQLFYFDCPLIHPDIESEEVPEYLEYDYLYITETGELRPLALDVWTLGTPFGRSGLYDQNHLNENAVLGAIFTTISEGGIVYMRRYDKNGLLIQTYFSTSTTGNNIWVAKTIEVDRLNKRFWVAREMETDASRRWVKIEEYNYAGTLLNTWAEEAAVADFRVISIMGMRWDGGSYLYYCLRNDITSGGSGVRLVRRLDLTTGTVTTIASTSTWSAGASARLAISPNYLFTIGNFSPLTTLFRTHLGTGATDSLTDAESVSASIASIYYDWKSAWLFRVGNTGTGISSTSKLKRMREDFSAPETLLTLTGININYTGIQGGVHPFPL